MGSIGQPTQGWLAWQAEFSKVGSWARSVDSLQLGMGFAAHAGTQNDEIVWNQYLDSGTWKVCVVHFKDTSRGIYTVSFDGATVGTIDGYSNPQSYNAYDEITGIVVATPGVKAIKFKMATKNASSTGYNTGLSSIALIKTAGAHSTGAGTDTPGYTWQHIAWMGEKSKVGTWTRIQQSLNFAGGLYSSGGAQNDSLTWDVWMDAGTHKFTLGHWQGTDRGIYSIRFDDVEKGTADGYAAASAHAFSEITGIVVPTAKVVTLSLVMATKHASSTAYAGAPISLSLNRTGA